MCLRVHPLGLLFDTFVVTPSVPPFTTMTPAPSTPGREPPRPCGGFISCPWSPGAQGRVAAWLCPCGSALQLMGAAVSRVLRPSWPGVEIKRPREWVARGAGREGQ